MKYLFIITFLLVVAAGGFWYWTTEIAEQKVVAPEQRYAVMRKEYFKASMEPHPTETNAMGSPRMIHVPAQHFIICMGEKDRGYHVFEVRERDYEEIYHRQIFDYPTVSIWPYHTQMPSDQARLEPIHELRKQALLAQEDENEKSSQSPTEEFSKVIINLMESLQPSKDK